ncbi:hypothetical protein E8E12_000979 [Didymella heteroderae]|uniref:Uncharacterized protein n=1 Tax=Didymella heteroderae TaxID=1769908 RepID=A0A9P5BU32_9PLEO|nr:hypothetical protein E8E12_000979 [Didymella heteroderae]
MEAARELAKALHTHKLRLVYGGGIKGLMGEVARALVSLSGPDSVHGIIPEPLLSYEQSGDEEIDVNAYGRTTVVKDMHERKKRMAKEVIQGGPGGGFVALSGGYGTLEELMEITTWNQLGIHSMPVVLYNVRDYWTKLLEWIHDAVQSGFVSSANSGIIRAAMDPQDVVRALQSYQPAPGRLDLTWEDN